MKVAYTLVLQPDRAVKLILYARALEGHPLGNIF